MNGKRVKSAIMSAVILSAVAVSGCSADGGVSLNESGVKAELSAFSTLPAKMKVPKPKVGHSLTAYLSQQPKRMPETTAVTTKKDNMTKAEWKETKSEGTKYVTVGCYSRKKAILGI